MFSSRHCLAVLSLLVTSQTIADSGDPVAVRRWPAGAISVETMWDLNLVVDITGNASQELKDTADQVVTFDSITEHVLHRPANSEKPQWKPLSKQAEKTENAVVVKSLMADKAPSAWGIQVLVDGVSILYIDAADLPQDIAKATESLSPQDVVVIYFAELKTLKNLDFASMLKALAPQKVIINLTPKSDDDERAVQAAIAAKGEVVSSTHNTLAIAARSGAKTNPQLYTLSEAPRSMPKELANLFARMEKSCAASQKVFAKLSTEQMNWKPSNGTHTPRWNTEHMMGRQLLFFSQIYAKIDPSMTAINLNPKQMPDDYQYAHADWTGAEEARQMQRVSKFTRRFAYLIDDLNVNRRAPGSRWPSLKALIQQMERHYSEHTSNTVKKFDLPDWPKN